MTLKYFLTVWLEKISELALVLVKIFWMSVDHDDEIVMGQIALEQQGCKGEGTWISSWGLDEVSFIKYCWSLWSSYCQTLWYSDNLPIFLYLIVVSFFFSMWLWNYFVREFRFHVLWEKKCIFLAILPFLVLILKRLKSWVGVFVLVWFGVFFSRKKYFQGDSSVKFRRFFWFFWLFQYIMGNVKQKNSVRQCEKTRFLIVLASLKYKTAFLLKSTFSTLSTSIITFTSTFTYSRLSVWGSGWNEEKDLPNLLLSVNVLCLAHLNY